MNFLPYWTRRQFLACSTAAVAMRSAGAQAPAQLRAQSAATSPEEIAGSVRGLMRGQTARPLRYTPRNKGFAIHNGQEFFNRPLYGPNNAFRVDCGDLPEFSLYLPGHGGNLRLGLALGSKAKWLFQADSIEATYRASRMLYEVRDALLGEGRLRIIAATEAQGSGLLLQIDLSQPSDVEHELQLIWAFGGVSGRKGKRGGDIGCEIEPVAQFFQVRAAECAKNAYAISGPSARLESPAAVLRLTFPPSSALQVSDGARWNGPWNELQQAQDKTNFPILIGSVPLTHTTPLHLAIQRETASVAKPEDTLEVRFADRCVALDRLAGRLKIESDDPFLDALGGALAVAADALWDDAQRCVMHGAVAWRTPLAGWRGPYMLDALGWHDRFREHARHWIARQNRTPVITASPALGGSDPTSHLARSENMLHSAGDLSHNHYDMNLVFFDALLRHLQWTGDLEFAREIWPAFVLHLAWEQRLFRRLYTAKDGKRLPLYEGYACIWASDNLQYSGGGAAHSSAYNVFANRKAAQLATMLGEDPAPYHAEAESIAEAMHKLLWLPGQGAFGESKDLMSPQTIYSSPALWTVYHTIDSAVPTPRVAWQMATERLLTLPVIPVEGDHVPPGGRMLSCSDWLPYEWSLNLLLLAENMHMALALWQAGMNEEAYKLFKGGMLDSLFMGLCPGNFHMTSQLDAHRQEAQRDFGDPIGITARALVEGLFGVRPDLLAKVVHVRPGFPKAWTEASLKHADFDLDWQRKGDRETFQFVSRLALPVALHLTLRAPRSGQPRVIINGIQSSFSFDPESIGSPLLLIKSPAAPSWKVEVQWQGEAIEAAPPHRFVSANENVVASWHKEQIDDPQGCLHEGAAIAPGSHTVFIHRNKGACTWWMPVSFTMHPDAAPVVPARINGRMETLDLTSLLTHRITEIFTRGYDAPRSPFCSLSIPRSGTGGWATFDRQPAIDDAGLRGTLQVPDGIAFRIASTTANCLFLSYWEQDRSSLRLPLQGSAHTLALLMAGTTFPQCSRMVHATVRVRYADGSHAELALRNPDNWWPIEQDYLLDDYLFVDTAPPPIRVDLATGEVRVLDTASFKGRGRSVPGGAANVITMALDPGKRLAALELQVELYGIVMGLLAATLVR
jgi:hypothetical protein